jgi:hypothetical protein
MEIFQYELLIAGGIIGIVVGSLGTTYWLGQQIKDLKNTILDKRTIVRFLKEALDTHKPKKTYKRKPAKKYRSNDGKTTATRKPVTRKKYEKAS